jgi:hypothetical protein
LFRPAVASAQNGQMFIYPKNGQNQFALEGTKSGPVREFGRAPNYDDYLKLDGEFEKRTLAFIEKNAAAKKPYFVTW